MTKESIKLTAMVYSSRDSRQSTKYAGEAHLAPVSEPIASSATSVPLSYIAELETDLDTGEMNCTDPRAYSTNFKTYNADNPSY